jgi:hypothetical protein
VGTKLIYIDDSGSVQTGFVIYSFCMVDISDWQQALASWLQWRAKLVATHQIPKTYELHATKFANGRGNPSLDLAWNRKKVNRHLVMDDAMATLAAQTWLGLGTAYSHTSLTGPAYGQERARVYLELVKHLDGQLQTWGDHGIIVMDGDGSDESYITAHRQLDLHTRALIEDPAFQSSHRSQWVQMADLVAYAAYQHLLQHPEKKFAWPWYPALQLRYVLGGPFSV